MQTTALQLSRRLTTAEVRTLTLASLRGALEFYDFIIFVFFTGVIGKLLFAASLPEWVRQLQTWRLRRFWRLWRAASPHPQPKITGVLTILTPKPGGYGRASHENHARRNSCDRSPISRREDSAVVRTAVTWVFNTFGTADLLFAFYLGSRISLPDSPGLLGAAYFILAAYLPLLLINHALAFRILLRTKAVAPSPSEVRTA